MEKSIHPLQKALKVAGFQHFQHILDLGFVGWQPPPARVSKRGFFYKYKSLMNATAQEIREYTRFDATPPFVIDIDLLQLPRAFKTELPKHVVATKYPYGKIGIAPLLFAQRANCDLATLDFYFGCSALHALTSERKANRKDRAPILVMKVVGTNMIMIRRNLKFGQDYNVPGFQFERLVTGRDLSDAHSVNFTEHAQVMQIGNFKVLMAAEVDAMDDNRRPVEIKLLKQPGGKKVFFQMIGSGSQTLVRGQNDGGVLTSVNIESIEVMAQDVQSKSDVESLEQKLLHNMERLKELDRQGVFNEGRVYRIDLNPELELHRVSPNDALLPSEAVVKDVLGLV